MGGFSSSDRPLTGTTLPSMGDDRQPTEPDVHDLRDAWQKAEVRVARFRPNSLLWSEAKAEADEARRAYEQRMRQLSRGV